MKCETNITLNNIDWNVFYEYQPSEPDYLGISILSENSYPGCEADIEITGVYTCDKNGLDHEWDLVEILSDPFLVEMEKLLISYEESKRVSFFS